MKTPVINHSSPWVTFLCLLLGIQLRAAQFVTLALRAAFAAHEAGSLF